MTSYIYDMVDTWNAGATTFTAVKMNVTDTASAAGSLLMDLQVDGSSRFNVSKTGSLKLGVNPTGTNQAGTNVIIAGSQGTGTGAGGSIVFQVAPAGSSGTAQNALATALTINGAGTIIASLPATNNVFDVTFAGTRALRVNNTALALAAGITFDNDNSYDIGATSSGRPRSIYAGTSIGFGSFGSGVWNSSGVFLGTNQTLCFGGASTDLYLHREGTGILAIRKSTDPQTFRLYNTWTSFGTGTEIWERGKFAWESNVLTIGTEKGANGGTARALEFQTDGVTRWTINNGQSAFWGANTGTVETTLRLTNTSGNFWFGIDTSSGGTFHSGTAYSRVLFASGNYPIAISTNSTRRLIISGDGLVQFAGTDNTFPALKRNSTALETKLADDSAYAPHAMQYLDVTDGITAPASATGRARIYVDTADGDLKVIFADGTVKTIVTDT